MWTSLSERDETVGINETAGHDSCLPNTDAGFMFVRTKFGSQNGGRNDKDIIMEVQNALSITLIATTLIPPTVNTISIKKGKR